MSASGKQTNHCSHQSFLSSSQSSMAVSTLSGTLPEFFQKNRRMRSLKAAGSISDTWYTQYRFHVTEYVKVNIINVLITVKFHMQQKSVNV